MIAHNVRTRATRNMQGGGAIIFSEQGDGILHTGKTKVPTMTLQENMSLLKKGHSGKKAM